MPSTAWHMHLKEVEMEKDVDVLGKYRNVTNKLKK
jgi:hypothetical protein